MKSNQALAALGALSHAQRLAIHRMLIQRGSAGLPAGTIAARLAVPPSSLTFHLQRLHRAGLIRQRRSSRQLIYSADFDRMNALVAYLTENCCGNEKTLTVCAPARSSRAHAGDGARR